jgi:hypothetical protein
MSVDAGQSSPFAAGAPELSIILPTDSWATIQPVVERYRNQTAPGRFELVFATPDPESFRREAGAALAGFGWTVVQGDVGRLMAARAAAIEAAAAPFVFLGETHTFAHPTFVEAVLRGHERWDVVVPAFDNANPGGSLSWAAFLGDYGWWCEGLEEQQLERWPTTNCSYRRSLLLGFGAELAEALEQALRLWERVRSERLKAGFVPAARIDHANVATPVAWMRERYLSGLLVGGYRQREWPMSKRILYAGGGPLLVPLLLKRTYGAIQRARRRTRLPAGTTLAWAFGTVLKACGETVGYIKGVSPADRDLMNEYEVHKLRHTGP